MKADLKTDERRTAVVSPTSDSEGNTQPRIIDMQHIGTQEPEEQPMSLPENIQLNSNHPHNVLHGVADMQSEAHYTIIKRVF